MRPAELFAKIFGLSFRPILLAVLLFGSGLGLSWINTALLNKFAEWTTFPITILAGLSMFGSAVLTIFILVSLVFNAVSGLLGESTTLAPVDRTTEKDDLDAKLKEKWEDAKREALSKGGKDVEEVFDKLNNEFEVLKTNWERGRHERFNSFKAYFGYVINVLEDKAEVADKKATYCLTRGMRFAGFGIGLYIVSIAVWQYLAAHFPGSEDKVRPALVYGIASCSILFVFIEFLSAWFFKQYRQFIDTSTYLVKIKAIFDRYYFLYLLATDGNARLKGKESNPSLKGLLHVLTKEIEWPDSYLTKEPDVSFAKEFMESMTNMFKVFKGGQSREGEEEAPKAVRKRKKKKKLAVGGA